MYDMEITELSRSYIIKLTNELGSDLCLIGGWATAAKNLCNLGHFVGGYNILLRIE